MIGYPTRRLCPKCDNEAPCGDHPEETLPLCDRLLAEGRTAEAIEILRAGLLLAQRREAAARAKGGVLQGQLRSFKQERERVLSSLSFRLGARLLRPLQTGKDRLDQEVAFVRTGRGVVAQMEQQIPGSQGLVIFLRSLPWTEVLFQRPHHLALALARLGYVVLFEEAFGSPLRGVAGGLYRGSLPERVLSGLCKRHGAVVWAFTYGLERAFSSTFAGASVLYDWIDDLDVFVGHPEVHQGQRGLRRSHERGLKEAALVVTVARRLEEQALAVRQDVLYLRNGVESTRFAAPEARLPEDPEFAAIVGIGVSGGAPRRPVAGYYGALARWFDYDLLHGVAKRARGWDFVLIGPQVDDSLANHPILGADNVYVLGPRPYETLPGYLRHFDVALIPFLINDITLSTSPLKLYEYLAAGKPVVATPMPECQAHREVHIAGDPETFFQELEKARLEGSDPERVAHLKEVGREHDWSTRAQVIAQALAQRKTP